MYQSLLQRGRPDKRDNYLRALEQETAHLEALIEDLFSLSQLDLQDAALLEHREVNLNRLVSQLAARFSTVAADQHIILAQDLDYALPPVEVNFDLIVQALTNLLGNAFVYTPPGGRVTLRTGVMKHGDGLYAAVLVDDTGAGVAPDEQARVFEPFFRGRASESQAAPGSGLGLSIVREIARLHRGHILLRSDGVPGKGSTFTLLLPLASTSTGDDQP
jgi:signal transduction histidine kinase